MRKGFCCAVAGGTSRFIVYPFDTIKKRMQMQVLTNTLEGAVSFPKYTSALDCLTKLCAQEGVLALYKGIVPTIFKSVVATSVTFVSFELAKDILSIRDLIISEKKHKSQGK